MPTVYLALFCLFGLLEQLKDWVVYNEQGLISHNSGIIIAH